MKNLLNGLDKLQLDKRKIITIMVIFFAIALVDILFLMKAQLMAIKQVYAKVAVINKDMNKLHFDLSLMKDKQSIKPKVKRKVKTIISENDILALLQDIDMLAKKNNIRIAQVKPGAAGAAVGNFSPVLISLEVSSTYHRLGNFINDLENAEKFIVVQGIEITPLVRENYLQQRVKLVLVTYVKK